MKKLFAGCLLLLVHFNANSQAKSSRVSFSSISKVGLAVGEADNALAVSCINGVQKGNWFAGIGTGIDFYKKRSVPLFLSVQKEFSTTSRRPFVYADGGVSFRWLKSDDFMKTNSTSSPGLYYECGLGWKIRFKNNTALLFSAGYSYKQVKEKANYYWYTTDPLYADTYEQYNYKYRRVMIRFGLQL